MKVQSYRGEYEVAFVDDIAKALSERVRSDDWLIVDEKVADIHSGFISTFKATNTVKELVAREETKSYEAAEMLIQEMIEGGFKRSHRMIAVGGGIIQDAVAFTASVLYRGIDWMFIPTTLLAQGDSCIGSKTSVNFGEYKNMLGGFHPAKEVLIDPVFLESLSRREVLSGLGEMSHYLLIGGREDFELGRTLFTECFSDRSAIKRITQRSLEIKKEMIERDEFDQGPRKIFNYGHTFGHALESLTEYRIPHGVAVAYGMDLANQVSRSLGLLQPDLCQEVREYLQLMWEGMPIGAVDLDSYLGLLKKDKKNVSSKLNLVLTAGLGEMFLKEIEPDGNFRKTVQECFEHFRQVVPE